MTKDEALKLALEALKQIDEAMPFPVAKLAQSVIKEALAQPEQEPVAWMCADESLINKGYARFSHVCMGDWKIPVYTTPPQRTWVGLTDEEINKIRWDWVDSAGDYTNFAQAIENKLKAKNT